MNKKRVIILGGGFAGLSCARQLVLYPQVHVTLIDQNNYHHFKPLLYQVATSALSVEAIASTFRSLFKDKSNIDIKMAKAIGVDPVNMMIHTKEGESYQGDFLVLSLGAIVNFFDIPGAEHNVFPLYTLKDAEKLRSRIIAVFENTDRDPQLIEQGSLNFVVVGAGATGIEIAGALADMFNDAFPKEFSDLAIKKAAIYLVDQSPKILNGFSLNSQNYGEKILRKRGVKIELGLAVKEVTNDYVLLSNDKKILTHTVIWAGGLKGASFESDNKLSPQRSGRINVLPDLTVHGFPHLYVLGDLAEILDENGQSLPQLGSVAQQSGYCAAKNIIADIEGKSKTDFQYKDKGIMAMIGKNAAVAEIGVKRRAIRGIFAFFAWLFVHAALLPTLRKRIMAIVSWSWNYFGNINELQILDNSYEVNLNKSETKEI